MSDWQPIETAPKDGTKFDAWAVTHRGERMQQLWPDKSVRNSKRIPNVYWNSSTWVMDEDIQGTYGGWPVESAENENEWTVLTHWMPLPEPPSGRIVPEGTTSGTTYLTKISRT